MFFFRARLESYEYLPICLLSYLFIVPIVIVGVREQANDPKQALRSERRDHCAAKLPDNYPDILMHPLSFLPVPRPTSDVSRFLSSFRVTKAYI